MSQDGVGRQADTESPERGIEESDRDGFLYRRLIETAARVDDTAMWQRVFARIEEGAFLARQADHLGSFKQGSQDLERYLLPKLRQIGDWPRWLHHAQVAAHLRSLAEALDEPVILEALDRSGRFDLAAALAAQLPRPLQRVRARAVLAAARPRDTPAFGRLLDELKEDLEQAGNPTDPATAQNLADALKELACRLAPELRGRWRQWIARVEPFGEALARDVWGRWRKAFSAVASRPRPLCGGRCPRWGARKRW